MKHKQLICSILTCWIVCCCTPQVSAQIKKGFEALKKRDFSTAKSVFEKDLTQPEHNGFARYGLALILMQGKNAKNVDSLMSADAILKELETEGWGSNEKEAALRKEFGISRKSVVLKRESIVEKLVTQMTEADNLNLYDYLNEHYSNWLKSKIEHFKEIRQEIVQRLFKTATDYGTLTAVYKRHQDVLRVNNLIFYDLFETKILNLFLKEQGLANLHQFAKDYPEHFVSNDCYLDALAACAQRDSVLGGLQFLDQYPLSILDFLAVNHAFQRAEQVQQRAKNETKRRWKHLITETELTELVEKSENIAEITQKVLNWLDQGYQNPFIYHKVLEIANLLHQKKADEAAVQILKRAQLLFPDKTPDNCFSPYVYYTTKQKRFNSAIHLLEKPSRDLQKTPFKIANTAEDHESSPVVTTDGNELYFARADGHAVDSEDVYICRKMANGDWSPPQKVPNLSEKGNEAPLSITADGMLMLVAVNGRLHFSARTATGWAKPVFLKEIHQYFPWIGKATLSSDGQVLLFEAGHQNSKTSAEVRSIALYASIRNADGSWREPFSLGSDVNKWGYKSRSPFLSRDDQTLYFSSDAFDGLGETDVLVTRRLDDSWKKWSAPINLGKEINSFSDDWGFNFNITPGSRLAYIGSKQKTYDIFTISLPSEVRPAARTAVVGKGDIRVAGGKIIFRDAKTGAFVSETTIQPDGTYSALLPPGKVYTKLLEKEGMLPLLSLLDLRESRPDEDEKAVETSVPMVFMNDLLEKQEAIPVDILFEKNQIGFTNESYSILEHLNQLFQKMPFQIEIIGHTDNTGDPNHNRKLSKDRAEAIKNYLVSKGIAATRITTDGKGSDFPIKSNSTEAGQKANRRVEIRLKR
jgi:outer membrane protein OmpA-like peptidoglycan-associated protein